MNPILLGNLISLVGSVLMVGVGFLKHKRQILAAQCVQFAIQGTAHLILGATAGFVSAVTGIARNIAMARHGRSVPIKVFFIALQAVLSLPAMSLRPVTWLPLLSGGVYTWFLDLRNPIALKAMMLGVQAVWIAYDFVYRNYVGMTFDIFAVLSTAVGLWLVVRDQHRPAQSTKRAD